MSRRSETAFERRDVGAGRILSFVAAVIAGLAASFAFVALLLVILHPERPGAGRSEVKEGIRLQVDPAQDRQRLQEKAAARLAGYGWIDARAGRAHIPIERAMALLAERGWPDEDAGRPQERGR